MLTRNSADIFREIRNSRAVILKLLLLLSKGIRRSRATTRKLMLLQRRKTTSFLPFSDKNYTLPDPVFPTSYESAGIVARTI